MSNAKFIQANERIMNTEYVRRGIGTLGEKTLHKILKYYIECDETCHEIKVGGYVADIFNVNGIVEIQTRQFNKLRNKLEAFLLSNKVKIVYPVPKNKWLIWIDENSGETTKKRKSPKTGMAYDIFAELYKIKSFLKDPNLSFVIVLLDIEEYRVLNGWSLDKKKGSTRFDRIPIGICEEINIDGLCDYDKLIPTDLPEKFTSKDFKKCSKLSISAAQTALNILNHVGVIKKIGKQGNLNIFERVV